MSGSVQTSYLQSLALNHEWVDLLQAVHSQSQDGVLSPEEAAYFRGVAETELNLPERAMKTLSEAKGMNPEILNARAAAAALANRRAEAMRLFAEASAAAPQNPRFLVNHGLALLSAGEADSAAPLFSRALQVNPEFIPAHFFLGRAALEAGRPAEAISSLENAVRLNPALEAPAALLAEAKILAGDPRGGLATADVALTRLPRSPALSAQRAYALLRLGRMEDALAAANIGGSPEASLTAAEALNSLGRFSEAIDRAVLATESNNPRITPFAQYELARAKLASGDSSSALAELGFVGADPSLLSRLRAAIAANPGAACPQLLAGSALAARTPEELNNGLKVIVDNAERLSALGLVSNSNSRDGHMGRQGLDDPFDLAATHNVDYGVISQSAVPMSLSDVPVTASLPFAGTEIIRSSAQASTVTPYPASYAIQTTTSTSTSGTGGARIFFKVANADRLSSKSALTLRLLLNQSFTVNRDAFLPVAESLPQPPAPEMIFGRFDIPPEMVARAQDRNLVTEVRIINSLSGKEVFKQKAPLADLLQTQLNFPRKGGSCLGGEKLAVSAFAQPF